MSNDDLAPVGDAEIRIAIEIGDNAQTTQRVKDAITELAAALADADDADVSGFDFTSLKSGSFLFDSRIGKPTLGYTASDGSHKGGTPRTFKVEINGWDSKWP